MHFGLITKVSGMLLMIFSFSMIPPALIAWHFQDSDDLTFIKSFGILFATGLALWLPVHRLSGELRTQDGFLVAALFWMLLGCMGSIPFILSAEIGIGVTDAVFESMSGLTATGATILSGIEELPESIRYYRQQLQWLGGMGIVVLAVAILPMLGIGGMQLYMAEIPGPMKDTKLTPRLAETAKALWAIYLFLTAACAFMYHWAGMSWFDAIGHSYSTVATGGFAMYDASLGYFDNPWIDLTGALFIFLGAVSFALHFAVWRNKSILVYVRDPEFRFFVGLITLYTVAVAVALVSARIHEGDLLTILRHSLFQALSFGTGTGLTSSDVAHWPSYAPYLLVTASFVGGCAFSTAAGMKVMRPALVFLQSLRELRRLIYPQAVFALRFGRHPVDDRILHAIWGFLGVYVLVAVLLVFMFMGTGMDFSTAYSTTAAALNNLGVGIAGVSDGFGHISDTAKWVMCFAMLLGRLEIFTLLVLFMPMFWRR